MGRDGVAFTFVVPGEGEILTSIERRINKELQRDTIDGFEAVPPPAAAVNTETQEKPTRSTLNPMSRKVKRRRL
jgi:ATP-dependent RNA helicase DeaD